MAALLENKYVVLALRIGFGAMWIIAAWDKIAHPDKFAIAVDNYHILPRALVHAVALILPCVEMLVGLCLVAGTAVEGAALLSAAMMVVFIIGLTQALVRGLDISCGCFSQTTGQASKISPWLVLRDAALIAGSVWILVYNRGRWSILNLLRRTPGACVAGH
ncbi:MAG: DoxX family membrane protein [Deltaproteobacteria bacterium]|nr:DoxX family membrane protein [Deltaproteobacteria bacterium]